MNILWLCLLSLLYGLVMFIYLGYLMIDKEKGNYDRQYINLIKEKKISIYCGIAVAVLCAVGAFLECIYKYNSIIMNIKLLTMLALLFPAAYIDKQQHIIPNKIILLGIIIRMVIWLIEFFVETDTFFTVLKSDVIAGVVVMIFFLLCSFISRNGLGMGDVKIMGLLGLYHGLTGVFSQLFFSLLVAFILSIYLLIKKVKKGKDSIAFAPAMLVGCVIATILTGL